MWSRLQSLHRPAIAVAAASLPTLWHDRGSARGSAHGSASPGRSLGSLGPLSMRAIRCEAEPSQRETAEAFMKAAAMSATAGIRLQHGGPFGAAVVRNGVIISCAHNMVLEMQDPCCHAEMNAIQQACQALGSHDLSDCELYTTCEPCPMCWGAVQWSRLGRAFIGVDRHTAAKYGFDDKVFYDEIDAKAGHYGIRRTGYIADTSAGHLVPQGERVFKNMVDVYDGILKEECESFFKDLTVNRTMRRRFTGKGGDQVQSAYKLVFDRESQKRLPPSGPDKNPADHEKYMRLAMAVAARGAKAGLAKERECFGAVIVKDGVVLAEACNCVLSDRDATATAEVKAIRAATAHIGSYNLEGCDLYTTAHPDLMSLGAILWSRISNVYCGVTQQFVAHCGFEEGYLHLKDLLETDAGGAYVTQVIPGVAAYECEQVFKEWADRNGVVY